MKRILIVVSVLLFSWNVSAVVPGDKIENFKLLDHTGLIHELHYLSDKKAVVLMVHGNGCPIARHALHTYKELRKQYQDQDVAFLMINSNLQDTRKSIAKEAEYFDIDFPILVDNTQLIGESLGIERTAESFVIDPKTWQLVYRGSLDDRLGYETQKLQATTHYVADALESLLMGKSLAVSATEAKGCIVNLAENDRLAHAKISYTEEIAPILIENCLVCHRDGGVGPFAMSSYNVIRGFAPMIREVIRTKRMPPWHADSHFGSFSNDRSLGNEETQKLVHWIEAGAPRGEGSDPLAATKMEWPLWAEGEPDLVIEIPANDVPATGIVEYLYPVVKNPLDHDVWVRAMEILPGSYEALHHVITVIGEADPEAQGGFVPVSGMAGYTPGSRGHTFPQDTGIFLPAGAAFRFSMHYTTFGKPVTDKTRLGIYFHKEKPKYALEQRYLQNFDFRIPANAKSYTAQESWTADKDLILFTLMPHSHFRGKASDFVARYPDGREEILLSVPNYDFNWQTTYYLTEPKILPAGTEIVTHTTWDNSSQNLANPNPNIDVLWGEQTSEEMLFGAMRYRYLSDDDSPVADGQ